MIKYKERPGGWTMGISGLSYLLNSWGNHPIFNSSLLLFLFKQLKIQPSYFLCHIVRFGTFLLILIEIYVINSLALGTFRFLSERFLVLFLVTIVFFMLEKGLCLIGITLKRMRRIN